GSIHRASTRDASCVRTAFGVQHNGFFQPGMAFVSTGPELVDETLFVWAGAVVTGPLPWSGSFSWTSAEPGLARIDRSTSALALVGHDDSLLGRAKADLTGTGDGKLYGFFTTTPATLAEIDLATGTPHHPRPLPGITGVLAWAFSFWRGDFYLYWSRAGE